MNNTLKRFNADALNLFEIKDILELGMQADIKRQELHPDSDPVTFVIDRNINYTNICFCKCKFCAFHRDKSDNDSYVLDYDVIKSKIIELVSVGGTQILLQGGLNKELGLDYYTKLISNIRKDFPHITIHAFSPPEITFIAQNNNISPEELLKELVLNGLSSIPGGGAEILSDEIRTSISPEKISSAQWLKIMETAHNLGLKTTATLVFGSNALLEANSSEKPRHIIEHLLKIRDLQDKTGGFSAFIPWTFQVPASLFQSSAFASYATSYDYLKVLAISRIVLDNIPNIQASWVTQGLKVAQLSLRFGANDFGGTMLEENVVRSAGTENKATIQEIIKNIQKAGFTPAQRDTAYNIMKIYK